jgi:photosystem II stability/assembly factor-like uncharacterized protein
MTLINIIGTALDPAQFTPDADSGSVIRFMLNEWMVSAAGEVIVPKVEECTWATDGTLDIDLESTHDAGPTNRFYRVTAIGTVDGVQLQQELGTITVPATPSVQDIADLLDTTGPPPPAPTTLTIGEIRDSIWWKVRDFGLTPTTSTIKKVSVKPDGSQYLAVGLSNWGYRSNDGKTWEQFRLVVAPDNGNVIGAAWNGTHWAAGCSSFIFTATDAFGTWTKRQTIDSYRMRYFGDVAGRFYCVSEGTDKLLYSDDNWVTKTILTLPAVASLDIAYSPSLARFVVTQNTGRIYTAEAANLTSWTLRATGITNNLNAVAWSPTLGLFLVVGDSGIILRSVDGITWVNIKAKYDPTVGASVLHDVIWTGDEFLFVADEANSGKNNLYSSYNGIDFIQRTVHDKQAFFGIWGDSVLNKYVVVGTNLFLMTLGI